MNIFLAEDNDADVYLIKEALSLAGLEYNLIRESDGEAAVRKLQQLDEEETNLAIALLDLNLPKRSGHEIIAYMRASDRLRGVPIVVITSSDSARDRRRAAEHNVRYYFRKPTDPDEFFRLGEIVRVLTAGTTAASPGAGSLT